MPLMILNIESFVTQWVEMKCMGPYGTTEQTVGALQSTHAFHSESEKIVSKNGPQVGPPFCSDACHEMVCSVH